MKVKKKQVHKGYEAQNRFIRVMKVKKKQVHKGYEGKEKQVHKGYEAKTGT